jgi:hypothetical protein
MEGKGRKWKGGSGLRCARRKFDCAWLGADGASWKHDGFDFPLSGGPVAAVADRVGRPPGSQPGLDPGIGQVARAGKAGAARPVVFSPTRRPEMAPQRVEKIGFAPGNGMGSGRWRLQDLGRAARRCPRRSSFPRTASLQELSRRAVQPARKWRRKGLKRLDSRPELAWPPKAEAHKTWRSGAVWASGETPSVAAISSGVALRQILAPKRLKNLSRCQNRRSRSVPR